MNNKDKSKLDAPSSESFGLLYPHQHNNQHDELHHAPIKVKTAKWYRDL